MKKKSLEQLALKKRTISNFSDSIRGGQTASSYPTIIPTSSSRPMVANTAPVITVASPVLPVTTPGFEQIVN